jgi:hypothetical protein
MPESGLFVFENALVDVNRCRPTGPGLLGLSPSVLRSLGGSGRSGNYCRTALQSTAHPGTQPCVLHSEQAHVGGGRPALAARCTRSRPP